MYVLPPFHPPSPLLSVLRALSPPTLSLSLSLSLSLFLALSVLSTCSACLNNAGTHFGALALAGTNARGIEYECQVSGVIATNIAGSNVGRDMGTTRGRGGAGGLGNKRRSGGVGGVGKKRGGGGGRAGGGEGGYPGLDDKQQLVYVEPTVGCEKVVKTVS